MLGGGGGENGDDRNYELKDCTEDSESGKKPTGRVERLWEGKRDVREEILEAGERERKTFLGEE